MDFKSAFINNHKDILIPELQRDYVQGATETVIVPFIDKLLEDDCDLNYIYGYNENGCFVPVDGQQRLITLWALYLYLHCSLKPNDLFEVALSFQSREFANEFCQRLRNNLGSVLKKLDTSKGLDKEIEDQNWFIHSWSRNMTVVNILNTLRYINKRIKCKDVGNIYNRFYGTSSPVTFAFLNMDEKNGLDDDIYIKMNGRGRQLSMFENLKSWMDQKVSQMPFAKEWKGYMDNRWTALFWKNRNLTQEHPEEIDDEQLHLFCNLLVLFHVKEPNILLKAISDSDFKEELKDFLDFTDDDVSVDIIFNKILSNLTKGKMPPLVWLERLNMMPDVFFTFVFDALNTLSAQSLSINDSGLYFGGPELDSDTRKKITRVYELCMTESSFGRTLPLLYSVICYKDSSVTSLCDWLRVIRNLILNREEKEGGKNADLRNAMLCIERFANKAAHENILEYLSGENNTEDKEIHLREIQNQLNAFTNLQIREEIRKSEPKMREFLSDFMTMENMRFFSGRISALFNIIPEESFDRANVHSTVTLLKIIFSGGDNGVTARFDDNQHYFRRILMSYEPYYYGVERRGYWSLCSGLEQWRSYVRGKDAPEALIGFVKEYALKDLSEEKLFSEVKSKVEDISRDYLKHLSDSKSDTFKYHFIHHPGVWDYMNTQLTIWGDNPFDIVLKKSDSNNSNRMELRTYALYLDYKHDSGLVGYRAGWNLNIYPKDNTCFYFERDITLESGSEYKLAIDVFFQGVNGKRDSENCYAINIFLRPKEDKEEEIRKLVKLLYDAFGQVFTELSLVDNGVGRFANSENLSRDSVIVVINELLSKCKD